MPPLVQIEAADRKLINSIDASMAEAVRRGGDWIACRIGCTECCMGPFGITQLDALRLQRGLADLQRIDDRGAQRVIARAAAYIDAISADYPGDVATGELHHPDALPESAEELPCPALDPESGRCDLYAWRPITCRVFGPATRCGHGEFAACELCYADATDEQIAACAVEVDREGIENTLLDELDAAGTRGITIVAFALRASA